MQRNGIGADEVELVLAGVADTAGCISFHDGGNSATTLSSGGSTAVEVTTVDAFAARRGLDVGLVKMDI